MRPSRRTLVLAALALCVPIPALALPEGDPAPETAGTLGVSATLDSCGIAGDQVVCKIDASWNAVPGATSYSASVTSPGGGVVDYGDAGGSGTSFWVPYAGPGTYTVTVSAYGDPPGPAKRELLTKDSSEAGGGKASRLSADGEATLSAPLEGETPADGGDDSGAAPDTDAPDVETPPCEEPPTPQELEFDEDGDGQLSAEERAKYDAAVAAEAAEPCQAAAPAAPAE